MPIDYFASITKKAFDNNFFVSECKCMQQTQYLIIKDIHSAAKLDLFGISLKKKQNRLRACMVIPNKNHTLFSEMKHETNLILI